MGRRPLAAAAVVAAIAALGAMPGSAAARTFSIREPVSFVFANACFGGEEFTVDGTFHIVGSEDGEHAHSRLEGSGVSADGTRYQFVAQSNAHQDLDLDAPGAKQFHFISRVTVRRQGSGAPDDDLTQVLNTHVTQNANGEITVEFTRFDVTCN